MSWFLLYFMVLVLVSTFWDVTSSENSGSDGVRLRKHPDQLKLSKKGMDDGSSAKTTTSDAPPGGIKPRRVIVRYDRENVHGFLDRLESKTGLYDSKSATHMVYDFEDRHEFVLVVETEEELQVLEQDKTLRVVNDDERYLSSSPLLMQNFPQHLRQEDNVVFHQHFQNIPPPPQHLQRQQQKRQQRRVVVDRNLVGEGRNVFESSTRNLPSSETSEAIFSSDVATSSDLERPSDPISSSTLERPSDPASSSTLERPSDPASSSTLERLSNTETASTETTEATKSDEVSSSTLEPSTEATKSDEVSSSTLDRPTTKTATSSTLEQPTTETASSSSLEQPTTETASSSTLDLPNTESTSSSTLERPTMETESSSVLTREFIQPYEPKSTQTIPQGIQTVGAPSMWEKGIKGGGIKICVVDSGVDSTHPDFNLHSMSGHLEKNMTWYTDGVGHGTHVVGTIAAPDNNFGVIGIAPEAEIFVVKVFDDDGMAAYVSSIVEAAQICKEVGAKIINMSLGGYQWNMVESETFAELWESGIITVAAAGNQAQSSYFYPASYSEVISVAALTLDNEHADFSNNNDMVDLAAPGVNINSTYPTNQDCLICNAYGTSNYGLLNGTSMATPHVAGVAALLWSFKPDATPSEVRDALRNSASDLGDPGKDDQFGYGLVNATSAIIELNFGYEIPENRRCANDFSYFDFEITTDDSAFDLSWGLYTLGGEDMEVIMIKTGLEDRQTYKVHQCIVSRPYELKIFDLGSDGLDASQGGGYILRVNDEVVAQGSNFDGNTLSVPLLSEFKGYVLRQEVLCKQIEMHLYTDEFPDESSLELVNVYDDKIYISVPTHAGMEPNLLHILRACLPADGCYRATIKDRFGDGLCCNYGEGKFELFYDNVMLKSGSTFTTTETHLMGENCTQVAK